MTSTTITPPRGTRWREVSFTNIHGEEYVAKFCNGVWFDCARSIDGSWTERSSFTYLLVSDADTELVWGLRANPTEPIPAPVVVRDAQWEEVKGYLYGLASGRLTDIEATDRIVALLRGERASTDQYDRLKKWQKWADDAASGHHDAPTASTDEEVRTVIDKKLNERTTAAQCLARLQELPNELQELLDYCDKAAVNNPCCTSCEKSWAARAVALRALVAPTPEGES